MAQSDQIKYSVVEGWEQLPKGWAHRDVAGVAVDQEDRVFLICRGDHPIIIYDQQGNFKRSWGEGEFSYRTHGIYVAPNGSIFCTDDGNHTVRQFTPEGKLTFEDGISDPGKYVEMRAETDVLALISNCPQLNNPCNAYNPTPVEAVIWEADAD